MDVLRELPIKFYEGPRRSLRSRERGNEEHQACFWAQEKCLLPKSQPTIIKGFHGTWLTCRVSSSQGRVSRSWFSRFIEHNFWVVTVATVMFFLLLLAEPVTSHITNPAVYYQVSSFHVGNLSGGFGAVLVGWLFEIYDLKHQTAFLICHQSRLSETEMTRLNIYFFMPKTNSKTAMYVTTK